MRVHPDHLHGYQNPFTLLYSARSPEINYSRQSSLSVTAYTGRPITGCYRTHYYGREQRAYSFSLAVEYIYKNIHTQLNKKKNISTLFTVRTARQPNMERS
jgi:hypothetical protein